MNIINHNKAWFCCQHISTFNYATSKVFKYLKRIFHSFRLRMWYFCVPFIFFWAVYVYYILYTYTHIHIQYIHMHMLVSFWAMYVYILYIYMCVHTLKIIHLFHFRLGDRGVQIQPLRVGFQPGLVSYQAENVFTEGSRRPAGSVVYLWHRKPSWTWPSRTGCGHPCVRGFPLPNFLLQMVGGGCGLNQDWSGENRHVVSVQMIVWLKFLPCGKVCPYYQLHLSSESKWKSRRSRCLLWFHHHLTSPAGLHFNALLYRCAIKNIQPPRPFIAFLPAIHRVASEGTLTPSWQIGAPQGCNEILEPWTDWFS